MSWITISDIGHYIIRVPQSNNIDINVEDMDEETLGKLYSITAAEINRRNDRDETELQNLIKQTKQKAYETSKRISDEINNRDTGNGNI